MDDGLRSSRVSQWDRVARFGKHVWAALLAWFILQFGFGGLSAVVFNLYLSRLGLNIGQIGLLNMAGGVGFAVFAVGAGAVGLKWGARATVLTGLSLFLVVSVLFPLAQFLSFGFQLPLLLAANAFYGLAMTLVAVNVVPILAGAVDEDSRVQVFAVHGATAALAGFLGSLVGGLLPPMFASLIGSPMQDPLPYSLTLAVMPVLIAALTLLFLKWTPRSPKAAETQAAPGPSKSSSRAPWGLMVLLFTFHLTRLISFYALMIFFSLYLDGALKVTTMAIGALIAVSRILPVPVAFLTPMLTNRFGKFKVIVVFSVLQALLMLPIGLTPQWWAAGVSLVGIFTINAITTTAFTTFQQEAVAPKWRGLVSGFVFTGDALGLAFASLAGGLVIGVLGYLSFFLMAGAITLVAPLFLWVARRQGTAVDSSPAS